VNALEALHLMLNNDSWGKGTLSVDSKARRS